MKCPHCEYTHGCDGEIGDFVEGVKASFFKLPVKMERNEPYRHEEAALYACPSCGKTFIAV